MMTFITEVLKTKLPDIAEVEIFLFEHCNLRCVHCFQDHEATVGMSEELILMKADMSADFMARNQLKEFTLNVMGGELFQDHLLDEYLPMYSKFVDRVRKAAETLGKKVHLNFVTNLLSTRPDVMGWLKKHDLMVSTSYDPTGRFNPSQFELFKKNIEVYRDRISIITGVATKQNISAIIKGDEYFTYLYDNFPFYWDQLTPGPTVSKSLMPKQSELLAFLKHLIDNYPKCLNVTAYTEPKNRMMSCPSVNKLLIEADNHTSGCRIKKHKEQSIIFISPVKDTNDELIENFVSKYDCLSCEYFNTCTFSCFVKHDWKQLIEDVDGCLYKHAFQHAETKTK